MIESLMNLDGNILVFMQEHIRTAILTPIITFITTLGNKGIIWILISFILLISKKTRKTGMICLCALTGSFLINNQILKNLFNRARPFDSLNLIIPLIERPTDFSFPSGHTASSFACAWVLVRKLPKRLGIPAIILASLIAFSRMYLGVHYPSDVIAGVISGILISYLAEFVVNGILSCIRTLSLEP